MTSPAVHIGWSSPPAHQKLFSPSSLSFSPFVVNPNEFYSVWVACPHTCTQICSIWYLRQLMIPFKCPWQSSLVEPLHTQLKVLRLAQSSLLLPSSSQNSHCTPDPVLTARAPCCKGNEGFILLNIMKQWEPLDGMSRLWAGAEGSTWFSSTTFLHLISSCINTNMHFHMYFLGGAANSRLILLVYLKDSF